MNSVTPYNQTGLSKKEQVRNMFDAIANRYDFLNRFLSAGVDASWRRKAVKILAKEKPENILDVATGTGGFAIELLALNPLSIIGIDISEKMLAIGNEKLGKIKNGHKIKLIKGDSEKIEFETGSFDAVTVAFGVRNFENLDKGLAEMYRVIKPGGKIVILEFSRIQKFPVKQLFNLYFTRVLPFVGEIISKDKRAYSYLPESVEAFPAGNDFLKVLEAAGFHDNKMQSLTFGIAAIYTGRK